MASAFLAAMGVPTSSSKPPLAVVPEIRYRHAYVLVSSIGILAVDEIKMRREPWDKFLRDLNVLWSRNKGEDVPKNSGKIEVELSGEKDKHTAIVLYTVESVDFPAAAAEIRAMEYHNRLAWVRREKDQKNIVSVSVLILHLKMMVRQATHRLGIL